MKRKITIDYKDGGEEVQKFTQIYVNKTNIEIWAKSRRKGSVEYPYAVIPLRKIKKAVIK